MTYKEKYMMCNTIAELEKAIRDDIITAKMINPDRLRFIKAAGEEVANLKFGGTSMSTGFNTQCGHGEHRLQFETDSREAYELMQEVARALVDGKLDRLTKICEAEREGRVVVLPCKVGDVLYYPVNGEATEYTITSFGLNGIALDNDKGAWIFLKHLDDGVVYLTREEAEAKLKEATP